MVKNALMEKILKNSPTKYTSILSESELFNEKDHIPTDVPILNIAFSGKVDGGICSGLTVFAGQSKTFKTNLSLVVVKAYLKKYPEAVCILYDSEGGATPDYLKSQGVDPSRVVHIPIDHLEMLKFDIVKQLKEINRGDKVIILIDSIGNTASLKEMQDALDEKTVADMQRAKVLKGLFRMITPALSHKDIPCLAVCHTYETMEMYSKSIVSGGQGVMLSANQVFIIKKSQEKDGDDFVGWNFTLNVEKSRFVREKSKLVFQVLYNGGVQKFSGLLDLALEAKVIIKPSNGWYSKVDSDGVISDKKLRLKQTENEEYWKDIIVDERFKKYVESKFLFFSDEPVIEELEEDEE